MKPTPPADRVPYMDMFREAVKAANLAGAAWLSDTTVTGCAHTKFVNIESSIARWARARRKTQGDIFVITHDHRKRPELKLKEACEKAAMAVFEKYGVTGLILFTQVDQPGR